MREIRKQRVHMVREAIDHWPSFVLHITRRLMSAADNFRVGEDARAVKLLRVGIDDLGEFMGWVEGIRLILEECGRPVEEVEPWRRLLTKGAGDVREAVARNDFGEAAARIEARLVNVLMGSGDLADRMCEDLVELQQAA